METLHLLIQSEIPFKINTVVMEEHNVENIIPLVKLTEKYPVSVRFIEEMPFNGSGGNGTVLTWTYDKIHSHIHNHYPDLQKISAGPHSTRGQPRSF